MRCCTRKRALSFTALLAILTVAFACGKPSEPGPFFREDLHPFGFPTEAHGRIIGNFTDINFLSDDLVLVSVNNRAYGPVEDSLSDQPVSKLLLFDASRRTLLKATELPVEKDVGSVRATRNGEFVLLNESGLRLCSRELQCGPPVATRGPLFVSPGGTRIVVGGNSRTEQKLLDSASLTELEHFSWMNPSIIPGDSALLIRQDNKLYIRLPQKPDQRLPFGGIGVWPEARFLNSNSIADFESDKALAVAKTDGTILFRVPVNARWNVTGVSTAASGSRFCFHEAGYTTFNSILNFYDIESSRPFNFENVNVLSTDSGKSLLKLRRDPRPYVGYLSTPALSPDGHRLAVIHSGFLEVFEVQ
jgi:hypothetical protein